MFRLSQSQAWPRFREWFKGQWFHCVTHTIAAASIGQRVKRMSEMTVLDNRGMGEVEIARNTGNKAQQKEKS